jgi:MFS family permease
MLVALAVFMASSLLCAAATSIELLTAARVAQGLGGGGLMTLSQAMIGETVPPRQRAHYQGYLASIVVTASTFGPLAGGFLTETLGWRSIFFVNIPLVLLAGVLAWRTPTQPRPRRESFKFDSLGVVLFALFIGPIVLAAEQAQRFTPGALTLSVLLITFGIICLYFLLKQEQRASHPLFELSLLRLPAVWRSDALAACHGAVLVSLVTYLPVYFHVRFSTGPTASGLLLLPLMIGLATGAMFTGRAVSRSGLTMIFPSIGMSCALVLLLIFSMFAARLSVSAVLVLLVLLGLAMGTVMAVVQITVQRVAGASSLGAAAASVQFSRSVGAAIGTALVGTALFVSLAAADPMVAGVFRSLIEGVPGPLAELTAERKLMAQTEIGHAFGMAFFMISVFAMGSVALAWSHSERHL